MFQSKGMVPTRGEQRSFVPWWDEQEKKKAGLSTSLSRQCWRAGIVNGNGRIEKHEFPAIGDYFLPACHGLLLGKWDAERVCDCSLVGLLQIAARHRQNRVHRNVHDGTGGEDK